MKTIGISALIILLAFGLWAFAQQSRDKEDDIKPQKGEYCTGEPWMMGRGMMGPGMMMGQGMRGRGMMGRGMMGGMGSGMMRSGMMPARSGNQEMMDFYCQQMGGWSPEAQPSEPVTRDEAQQMAEEYLESVGNSDLKVGKIEDKGDSFEVEVVTQKEGALVSTILIDKATGQMRPKS